MKLIPLKATSEHINMKKGGVITYETDVVSAEPGIILLNNPDGDYGVAVINQLHTGGPVKVLVKAVITPARKYEVNDTIGHLAVF